MEQRGGAHEMAVGLEGDTAGRLRVLQLVDGGEMAAHQYRAGEPPQILLRLDSGGYGGKNSKWTWFGTRKRCVL